jgi:hypothetical protein
MSPGNLPGLPELALIPGRRLRRVEPMADQRETDGKAKLKRYEKELRRLK